MDAFLELAAIEQPTDPFAALAEQDDQGTPDGRTPAQMDRVARMAAIASSNPAEGAKHVSDQINSLTEKYRGIIEQMGDNSIRREMAVQQRESEVRGYQKLFEDSYRVDPEGELTKGAVAAANAALAEDVQKREEYALEQAMVDRIQDAAAAGDRTQAEILLNNMEFGGTADIVRDMNIKRLILQREIEKASIAKEEQGLFLDAADFLMGMLPLNYSLGSGGNVDLPTVAKRWYDSVLSGQRVQSESDSLYQLHPADFAKYVREKLIPNIKENSTLFGFHDKAEQLSILSNLQYAPMAAETNAFNFIDNVGLLAPAAKSARALASLPLTMARMGARREAANVVAQAAKDVVAEGVAVAERKSGVSVDDVVDNMSVSAVNPNGSGLHVPLAEDINRSLFTTEEVLAEMPELLETQRLTQAELDRAIEATRKRAESSYGRPIKDVVVTDHLATGQQLHYVDVTIGKTDGTGFARKGNAENLGKSLGYQNAATVQDESGQWFLKVREPVVETGFYTEPLQVQATNLVSRKFLNARLVGDKDLADAAQASGNRRNKILVKFVNSYVEKNKALNNAQRERVGQVLAAGNNEGRWWTDDELSSLYNRAWGREPTLKEVEAYRAAVKVNDVEYVLRNLDMHVQRSTKGFKTISFDTGIGKVDQENAIIDRELVNIPKTRIYDVNNRIHYTDGLDEATVQRLKSEGYMLVSTERAVELADDTTVKQFLIKGSSANIEDLRWDQIHYRAGGHRFYDGTWFAKQTRKGLQKDTGKEFLMNPRVFTVGRTKAEIDFWTSTMEQARVAALKGADEVAIDDIFKGHAGFPSGKEFLEGLESGAYGKNEPFQTFYDREMPREYHIPDVNLDFVDLEESGFNGFLRTQGRMYYGAKGDQLKDFRGALAPTLDPYQTINMSLKNIASITSFSDYKMQAVERWAETFKPYLGLTPDEAKTRSAYWIFNNKKMAPGAFPGSHIIEQQMEAQREIVKRTLGWKTPWDLQQEQWTKNLANWIGGSDPTSWRNGVAAGFENWAVDSNPVSKLKGMVFDLKLGLFNYAQFPLQLSTMWATTTLAGPKTGLQGMFAVAPIRSFLTKGGSENLLDLWVKRGIHKNMGLTEDEFKVSMRAAKKSGFFDVQSGTHQLQSDYGSNAAKSDIGNAVDSVRSAGRFFFNEAEVWNRSAAWHVAWQEIRSKFPDLKYDSPEFLTRLQGRAEEYAFNMSEQSSAWWQKGVMSIPTQFWAYNVRMLEAMMGPSFTGAQKARLIAGQALLAGSAGLPIIGAVSEMYEAKTGKAFKPDTFYGALDRGILDTIVYHTQGADVLIGERYGTGNWSTEVIKDIFGMSAYGEKSTLEMAGGATLSVAKSVSGTMWHMLKYVGAESGGELDRPFLREDAIKLAQEVSLFSNLHKAWLVSRYGTIVSKSGTTPSSGLPPAQVFWTALSLQPGQQDDISAMMAYNKDEAKIVDDASRVIQNYRTRALNEPDKAEDYIGQIKLYVQMLPPDIRKKALRKAHGRVDKSLYEGLSKRMERERIEDQMIEQQEQEIGAPE